MWQSLVEFRSLTLKVAGKTNKKNERRHYRGRRRLRRAA